MSVVGIIKYAENGSSWMVSCRLVARTIVIPPHPPFFYYFILRIVKDFTAIQIKENCKDDENYSELKNIMLGFWDSLLFLQKGQHKGDNPSKVFSTKNLPGN